MNDVSKLSDKTRRQVDDLRDTLRKCAADCKYTIYEQQMEWARHFNGLIWTISSIMLPISFAGLSLTFKGETGELHSLSLVFTAAASIVILLFWLLLGNWHRKLWQRCFVVATLVEESWDVRRREKASLLSDPLLSTLTELDEGRWLRRVMTVFGIALWIGRVYVEFQRQP